VYTLFPIRKHKSTLVNKDFQIGDGASQVAMTTVVDGDIKSSQQVIRWRQEEWTGCMSHCGIYTEPSDPRYFGFSLSLPLPSVFSPLFLVFPLCLLSNLAAYATHLPFAVRLGYLNKREAAAPLKVSPTI
jgi:hypothetical protein